MSEAVTSVMSRGLISGLTHNDVPRLRDQARSVVCAACGALDPAMHAP